MSLFHKCTLICTNQNEVILQIIKFFSSIIISVYFIFYFGKSLLMHAEYTSEFHKCGLNDSYAKPFYLDTAGSIAWHNKRTEWHVFSQILKLNWAYSLVLPLKTPFNAVKLYLKSKGYCFLVFTNKISYKNSLINIRLN